MRIIGGEFKGRKFIPPAKNWPTRPTTDFAKEGLFNILSNRIDLADIRMLDLFGGTGNHSYEAISRGCRDVTYVDQHFGCVKFVKETSELLQIQDILKVTKADVKKYISSFTSQPFDYIFAGPPYALNWLRDLPNLILEKQMLTDNGLMIIEHDQQCDFSNHPSLSQSRKYGLAIFSFFESTR